VDFFAAMRLIVRRWYVVASALIVTLAVAYTVMQSVAPTYRAEGSVLLFAPSADSAAAGAAVNPFRSFDASTAVLAAVIVQIMNDTDVRAAIAEGGGRPDFVVGQSTDGTPVIVTRATDPDEARAILTVRLAMEELQAELDRRQADAGAPEEVRIRAIVLTEPTDTDALVGARIRAFLAVMALGVAASVSVAFIVESLAQSRRRMGGALDVAVSDDLGIVDDRHANGAGEQPRANGARHARVPHTIHERAPADLPAAEDPSVPTDR
jgi:hypothetical protein